MTFKIDLQNFIIIKSWDWNVPQLPDNIISYLCLKSITKIPGECLEKGISISTIIESCPSNTMRFYLIDVMQNFIIGWSCLSWKLPKDQRTFLQVGFDRCIIWPLI